MTEQEIYKAAKLIYAAYVCHDAHLGMTEEETIQDIYNMIKMAQAGML